MIGGGGGGGIALSIKAFGGMKRTQWLCMCESTASTDHSDSLANLNDLLLTIFNYIFNYIFFLFGYLESRDIGV